MTKKIVALLIILVIALLCLAGCVKPVEPTTVTLNVKVPSLTMTSFCDSEVNTAYKFLQKAVNAFKEDYNARNTGLKVEINLVEFEIAKETKYISETFDTADSPDVLYEGYFNMSTYIYTGRVVPLDNVLNEADLDDISSQYLDLSRVDGKLYMMPFLTAPNTMSFNGDIFRDAGLTKYVGNDKKNVVQTWSLDEWNEVLDTLATYCADHNSAVGSSDKSDKMIYPMMMYGKNDQGDTHIMTLLRSHGCSFFDKNGKVDIDNEEGIAALKWLQDGIEKGYYAKNSENSTINDNTDLFMSGQLALLINNPASESECIKRDIDVYSVNFPYNEQGKGLSTDFITGFEVFDNGDANKLTVAKEFVRYIYASEYKNYMAGSIPCSKSVSQKYADELLSIRKYVENDSLSWNFTNNSPNWRGVRDVFYQNIHELLSLYPNTPADIAAKRTPEAIAKAINESCNTAISEGFANAKLHD